MKKVSRRRFLQHSSVAGMAVLIHPLESLASELSQNKLRVAVIGCGSVSNRYLPQLKSSAMIDVVSVCDIRFDRAEKQAKAFGVPNAYPNINDLLKGAPFDMMVTLTDMQVHGELNKKALEAGKHVWSEKPLANSYSEGKALLDLAKKKNIKLWGAPAVVNSPQYSFMNDAIQSGKLGRLAAAHGQYGHPGPTWSAFFYEKGGGSMPDLGVYNLSTLTGLLGPARSVMAMTNIINPERTVDDKGKIKVAAEDNAHVLMEHDNHVISHMMCGFNYFDPHGHDAAGQTLHTIQIYGDKGNMRLIGYDWEPKGVVLETSWDKPAETVAKDAKGYEWQEGARVVGESIVKNQDPKIQVEHALHVLEVIEAARKSSETGMKVKLQSSFKWPIV